MRNPKVLVVYKRSPLLSAGTSCAARTEKFRRNHENHYATLKHIERVLRLKGVSFHKHLRNPRIDYRAYDLLITVGGDGTFLDAARHASKRQLVLGINSDPSWSVGKFCAADARGFEVVLEKILSGEVKIFKVHKLRASFRGSGGKRASVECLNDMLVCHANPAAMSRYVLTINKKSEDQRSSGVWFAAAAGSTGAIASSGGVKLPLKTRRIQYKPRELYHGRGVAYRFNGGVIRPGGFIEIVSRMPHGRIFLDGAHIKYPFTFGNAVRIESSPNFVQMVHA